MKRILISTCLGGQKVRFDGSDGGDILINKRLSNYQEEMKVVSFCPEISMGLSTPRKPAEICHGDADDLLNRKAKILEIDGTDVSDIYLVGANLGVDFAKTNGVVVAILKDGSPSCGSKIRYDGSFSGKTLDGEGIFCKLLKQNGIKVFNEDQLEEALDYFE